MFNQCLYRIRLTPSVNRYRQADRSENIPDDRVSDTTIRLFTVCKRAGRGPNKIGRASGTAVRATPRSLADFLTAKRDKPDTRSSEASDQKLLVYKKFHGRSLTREGEGSRYEIGRATIKTLRPIVAELTLTHQSVIWVAQRWEKTASSMATRGKPLEGRTNSAREAGE